jgi:hypothetical protein
LSSVFVYVGAFVGHAADGFRAFPPGIVSAPQSKLRRALLELSRAREMNNSAHAETPFFGTGLEHFAIAVGPP